MTRPKMTGANTTAALLLVFAVLGCGACHRHTVHAAAPVGKAPEKTPAPPTQPPPDTPSAPDKKSDSKPEETAPAPPTVNPTPKQTPSKPHVNPPPTDTTPETPPPPKPPAPQIRPRLTPEQTATLQRKTNEAIAEAEKNLQGAYGRPLNEAQRDLIEKIRGFISQAREAGDAADWSRASNLAEKARVLSIELANSLS